ncbi:hypothetical protein ACWDA9_35420, partial [Streptomyces sp. NPDC001193]
MDRVLKALGAAHEGSVGVLLSDGTEPGPVYFDVGSGPDMPSSTEWHAYDGRRGRPRAALLRGSCSCGWRGAAEYPLDWTTLAGDQPLYEADVDLSGPIGDNEAHGRGGCRGRPPPRPGGPSAPPTPPPPPPPPDP